MARQYAARYLGSYLVLGTFLLMMFIFGVGDEMKLRFGVLQMGLDDGVTLASKLPDISRFIYLKTLDERALRLDDPSRRIIFIGDIHGMRSKFDALLLKANYNPSNDLLVHVGDIVAKGPHVGSMSTLSYMYTHNITGVRGNHDEKVIEWRGWIDWVESHEGGVEWLRNLEKKSLSVEEWKEYEEEVKKKKPKEKWRRIPKGWKFMKDHYKIAREMTREEYLYLLNLPLVLHIPSLHTFVVHAGVLPYDPHHSISSIRQPLAHIPKKLNVPPPKPPATHIGYESNPSFYVRAETDDSALESESDGETTNKHPKRNTTALRTAQELSVLADVQQNWNPWMLMNIRGVTKDGDATKDNDGGVPWAHLWNSAMSKCHGFDSEFKQDDESSIIPDHLKQKNLPCYPSTVVYGHAAKRGLDIRRWSKGLDAGCVYDKQLAALILTKHRSTSNSINGDNNNGIPGGDVESARGHTKFGEDGLVDARVVHVSC